MNHSVGKSRRQFLGTLAGTALLGAVPELAFAGKSHSDAHDLELELRAEVGEAPILPGAPTRVWRYQGKVLKGDPAALVTLPNSYLGPIIRTFPGQRVRVHFVNSLPEPSIIHWHGLIVPHDMDGHPSEVVPPGGRYEYAFTVRNRPGTYWYHPHAHGLTGEQVNAGLAGLFIVEDPQARSAGLPVGDEDLAMVIQDRSFLPNNQLRYLERGMGMMGMMGAMTGFLGDKILVNGQADFSITTRPRAYRLRFLNGCNSRTLKLAWSDGTPMTVVATDGGLLGKPVSRPYVTLAPAERVELWIDLSNRGEGDELGLVSLPFATGASSPMMGMMNRGGLQNGAAFQVLKVKLGGGARVKGQLPARLSEVPAVQPDQAINRDNPRTIRTTVNGMRWGLNGRVYEMGSVADDEIVRLNTTEIWEFANTGSMGMMGAMPHPMHMHGVQFRVLGRRVDPAMAEIWRTVSDGYVDDGWKDTVLVMPGEHVWVQVRFDGYPGMFLYHCHNLEHADMGMMRNYLIQT